MSSSVRQPNNAYLGRDQATFWQAARLSHKVSFYETPPLGIMLYNMKDLNSEGTQDRLRLF